MTFITGGGLRIDTLITQDGQAHVGLMGGNGLYAAVGATLWSEHVSLWARVGDNYPRSWIEALPHRGIGIEGVIRVPGEQDHRTFYAYTPDGHRDDTNPAAHFARINQPLPAELHAYVDSTPGQDDPHHFEPLALRPADWYESWSAGQSARSSAVHLSPLALNSHLHLPPYLRHRGIKQITADPGEKYMVPEHAPAIRRLVPWLDAFLPSAQEVWSLFGEGTDLWQAAATLCQWGAPLVVIKQGAEGILLREERSGLRSRLPAYHRPGDPSIVDVTGAGDAFCGGFMVGLGLTNDPLEAARMGLVSASFAVEGYGALYALDHCDDKTGRLSALKAAA